MPSAADRTRCDWCGAEILWTVTASGARMAVNADPDPAGNQAVYADGVGRLRSRGISTDRPTLEHNEWRAMPHVATCTRPRQLFPAPRRPRPPVRRAPWRPR